MVIWLLAGGGESEVRGLVPFFEKHFQDCSFVRLLPVKRRPGPRPNKTITGYGATGDHFIKQLKRRLSEAVQYEELPDIILGLDDLDCRDYKESFNKMVSAVESVEQCKNIKKIAGFASPELESWIIASWDSTVAKHPDFRKRHEKMRYWPAHDCHVSFADPESFSSYDDARGTCIEKLSELIVNSSMINAVDHNCCRYSKSYHTPALLRSLDIEEVKGKCPIFNRFITELQREAWVH